MSLLIKSYVKALSKTSLTPQKRGEYEATAQEFYDYCEELNKRDKFLRILKIRECVCNDEIRQEFMAQRYANLMPQGRAKKESELQDFQDFARDNGLLSWVADWIEEQNTSPVRRVAGFILAILVFVFGLLRPFGKAPDQIYATQVAKWFPSATPLATATLNPTVAAQVALQTASAQCSDFRFGGGDASSARTALSLSSRGLNLLVCATNLTGCPVYAYTWRDSFPKLKPYSVEFTLVASKKLITIQFPTDPDEADVPQGTYYYSVISMTPLDITQRKSYFENQARSHKGCFGDTNALEMCDSLMAGATSTPEPKVLCQSLRTVSP
jgi:hypothetical protein